MIFSRIRHFIEYHNAAAIAAAFLVGGAGIAFAASPAARDVVYSSSESAVSVDNSYIRQVDLDQMEPKMIIRSVQEDQDAYYVEYSYNTVDIRDYAWRPVSRDKTLTVSKTALGTQDLGEYVAEQVSQVVSREISYLKRAQNIEREKGPTQKVLTTRYAGLVGAMLSPEDRVFPAYDPVVQSGKGLKERADEARQVKHAAETETAAQNQGTGAKSKQEQEADALRRIVEEYLAARQTESGEPRETRIQKLETQDASTGETYCLWIDRGEWKKIPAPCDSIEYLNGQPVIIDNSPPPAATESQQEEPSSPVPDEQDGSEEISSDEGNEASEQEQETGSVADSEDDASFTEEPTQQEEPPVTQESAAQTATSSQDALQ